MKKRRTLKKIGRAFTALRNAIRHCWVHCRSTVRRVLLLILVAALVYVGSGFYYIPQNALSYLYQSYSERSVRMLPYEFYNSLAWAPPSYTREIFYTSHDFPSTDNFLQMAYFYDAQNDAAIAARQTPLNPRGETQVMEAADIIVSYLREMDGVVYTDFEFNGVAFFQPDASAGSRYDVEIAHWARILYDEETGAILYDENGYFIPDNRVHINMAAMALITSRGQSFFGLLTHELVHGALELTLPPTGEPYYDQEVLTQIVTAQALYNMMQGGVDGADIAFYQHMRDMALYSALWRARFGTDEYATGFYGNLVLAAKADYAEASTALVPTVWQGESFTDFVFNWVATAIEILKGNPYARIPTIETRPRGAAAANWYRQTYMLIRQNGIHIRPNDLLLRWLGPDLWGRYAVPLETRIWGRDYPYVDYILLEGELERVERANDEMMGVSSREGQEQWRVYNSYFYATWAKYEYAPLSTIISNVNYNFSIFWWGMKSSDLNLYFEMYMGWVDPNDVFERRSIDFEPRAWDSILAPLGLQEREMPTDRGDCIRAGGQGPCIAVVLYSYEFGDWRPFPIIPLLLALVLVVDAWVLRRWGTRRALAARIDKKAARPTAKVTGKALVTVGKALKRWSRR